MTLTGPDIKEIRALREQLTEDTAVTPVVRCAAIEDVIGEDTEVVAKMEFLQRTGTFKARGALATLHTLAVPVRCRNSIFATT